MVSDCFRNINSGESGLGFCVVSCEFIGIVFWADPPSSEVILSFKFICQCFLSNVHGKRFRDVAVADSFTALVFKHNMFPVLIPVDNPAMPRHGLDEFFFARRVRDTFHQGDCTVHNIALSGFVKQQMIFVLAPGMELAFL
jgi:hypothetical protein